MENKIIKEFKKLKKDISPRPEWVALSRDILLQQINPKQQHQPIEVGIGGYFQLFIQVFQKRMLEPAVIMLLVLGVFAMSSLTINAAFYSLPGDHLYSVKLALENTHVALVSSREKKVELKMESAQKRVAELDKIISQVNIDPEIKKKKIEAVVKEFKNNVVAVSDHLNKIKESDDKIAAEDKAQTVQMALAVSSKTEEMAKSFDEKIEELPAVEKLEVEEIVAEAVQSAQETSLSAQELVDDANQPTEEGGEEGVIEGAEVEEPEAGLEDDSVPKEGETVEASTVEAAEEEKNEELEEEPVETEDNSQDSEEDALETTEEIIE